MQPVAFFGPLVSALDGLSSCSCDADGNPRECHEIGCPSCDGKWVDGNCVKEEPKVCYKECNTYGFCVSTVFCSLLPCSVASAMPTDRPLEPAPKRVAALATASGLAANVCPPAATNTANATSKIGALVCVRVCLWLFTRLCRCSCTNGQLACEERGCPKCDGVWINGECKERVCEEGARKKDDCNTCTCSNNAWVCTKIACKPCEEAKVSTEQPKNRSNPLFFSCSALLRNLAKARLLKAACSRPLFRRGKRTDSIFVFSTLIFCCLQLQRCLQACSFVDVYWCGCHRSLDERCCRRHSHSIVSWNNSFHAR